MIALLAHPDAEVRMRSAEALGVLVRRVAPASLIRALEIDTDELVRAEAADSLGAIRDQRAALALRRALNDRSWLVRGYAASALGELGNTRNAAFVRSRLAKERRAEVRVGLFMALYCLGDQAALAKLLNLLHHSRYHVRCAVANDLSTLGIRKKDTGIVVQALRNAGSREQTTAAASSIAGALRSLDVLSSSSSKRRRTVR